MIFSAVTSKAETWLTDDLLPKINLLVASFLPDSWGSGILEKFSDRCHDIYLSVVR